MFGQRVEATYSNRPTSAGREAGSALSRRLLLLITVAVGVFFYWANSSEIEEYTRSDGQVIPSSKVQIVQSLEGGIVQSIEVSEGDLVQQGDVLMQIDDTRFSSEMGELKQRRSALMAERLRLIAESNMADELAFPDELVTANPRATGVEQELFYTRRQQLARELDVLNDRMLQRQSELAELEAQQLKRRKMVEPLREEVELATKMTRSGVFPRIELLRLNSQLAALEGDLAVGEATKVRLQSAITQAGSEIEVARSGYLLTARQRLAQLQVELSVVEETLRAASDRVARTLIRAPLRGTVNALAINTPGAVVGPGQPLAEIVPTDDGLVIEAYLRPTDVAFVKPGADVSIKITAYDYLIYGSLNGRVERIGADTITSDDGTEFFKVVVETDQNFLGSESDPLPISPGMVAKVDILTGKRTVMDYLLKPIRRAQYEAMRER
nr:HlyD family type I secretion periplasmic adaptor subunit [Ruegeria marina]